MGRSDLPYMYARARGRTCKSQLHMLHMLCNTSSILKIALQYIGKDGTFDYGI